MNIELNCCWKEKLSLLPLSNCLSGYLSWKDFYIKKIYAIRFHSFTHILRPTAWLTHTQTTELEKSHNSSLKACFTPHLGMYIYLQVLVLISNLHPRKFLSTLCLFFISASLHYSHYQRDGKKVNRGGLVNPSLQNNVLHFHNFVKYLPSIKSSFLKILLDVELNTTHQNDFPHTKENTKEKPETHYVP